MDFACERNRWGQLWKKGGKKEGQEGNKGESGGEKELVLSREGRGTKCLITPKLIQIHLTVSYHFDFYFF